MGQSALVFPGQGAQSVGMGRDVAEASNAARAVFDQANDVLGFDIAALCFEGPSEKLAQTNIQQPAIFVTSVAIWKALEESGTKRDQFSYLGGLSLGEYTALYVAGAVEFEDALRLVQRRGELMQRAALASPSGMVSLIGGDEEGARALCDRARQDDVLAPANFNCPGQVVISGTRSACDRALSLASEFGCRGIALEVAGAFHSPLMESAAQGLHVVLEKTPFTKPNIAVIANVDAQMHRDGDAIRQSLQRQVTHPVLWQRSVEKLIELGVDRFVEVGPGRVLTGLMRKINRKIAAVNINSMDSIQAATTT